LDAELVEMKNCGKKRGLCCGAGGAAKVFKEPEQGKKEIFNIKRSRTGLENKRQNIIAQVVLFAIPC